MCINWSALHRKNTLADLLRYGQEPLRSVQSHNTTATKNMGRSMRGGTATVLTQHLSSYVKDCDTDYTGLGRWSWYLLEGEPGHRTRVITAYAPCGSASGAHPRSSINT